MISCRHLFAAPTLLFAILLIGCGEGPDARETEDRDVAPESAEIVREITITGDDMMTFDPTEFTVKAGEEITVIFQNIGEMPVETMGHNLAILEAGTDVSAFASAAVGHSGNDYIAPEYAEKVIAATRVLGPGEEETLVFTAPEAPGEYPFVCSFPAHTPAGMVGVMRVVE